MRIVIGIDGCDDSTTFPIEGSYSDLVFALRLSEISKQVSRYGCMPTLSVNAENDVAEIDRQQKESDNA